MCGEDKEQIGAYLKVLTERFRLVERKLPVFSKAAARQGRYYLADNFLRAWLAALAQPVSAVAFRPVDQLVAEADARLADVEGGALERLVATLYQERSRKGLGDFPITRRIDGFWDRAGTEIDLVAVNEDDEVIRFGSCKRAPAKLTADVNNFKSHCRRFLELMPQYQGWRHEYVGIAPDLPPDVRRTLEAFGVIPQDLEDLTRGL